MSFDTQMTLLQFKQETELLTITENISASQVSKDNVIIIKDHIYKKFLYAALCLDVYKNIIFNMLIIQFLVIKILLYFCREL